MGNRMRWFRMLCVWGLRVSANGRSTTRLTALARRARRFERDLNPDFHKAMTFCAKYAHDTFNGV